MSQSDPDDTRQHIGGIPQYYGQLRSKAAFGLRFAFHRSCGELDETYGKRSEEHTSELQSHHDLVCRLLLEKKKKKKKKKNYKKNTLIQNLIYVDQLQLYK